MAGGISLVGAERVFQPAGPLVLGGDWRSTPIEQAVCEAGHPVEVEPSQEVDDIAGRPFGLEHDVREVAAVGEVAHLISPEDEVTAGERASFEMLPVKNDIAIGEGLPGDSFHSHSPESPSPTLTGRDAGGKSA